MRDATSSTVCAADVVLVVSWEFTSWYWEDRLAVAVPHLVDRLAASGVDVHLAVLRDAAATPGAMTECTSADVAAVGGHLVSAGSSYVDPADPSFPSGCLETAGASRAWFALPTDATTARRAVPCLVRVAQRDDGSTQNQACADVPLVALAQAVSCGSACPENAGFFRDATPLAFLVLATADDCSSDSPDSLSAAMPDTTILPGATAPVHAPCLAARDRGQLVAPDALVSSILAAHDAPLIPRLVAGPLDTHRAVTIADGTTHLADGCFTDRGYQPGERYWVSWAPRLGAVLDVVDPGMAEQDHDRMCDLPGFSDAPSAEPDLTSAMDHFVDEILARVGGACHGG